MKFATKLFLFSQQYLIANNNNKNSYVTENYFIYRMLYKDIY